MPKKVWGRRAVTRASCAVFRFPSVRFLKPTGMGSLLASSRWIWLSLVRAPMHAQDSRSSR